MKLVIALFVILIILVLVILYLHFDKIMVLPMKLKPKLGGCKGTRYGCCPDGTTSRNKHGTNC